MNTVFFNWLLTGIYLVTKNNPTKQNVAVLMNIIYKPKYNITYNKEIRKNIKDLFKFVHQKKDTINKTKKKILKSKS